MEGVGLYTDVIPHRYAPGCNHTHLDVINVRKIIKNVKTRVSYPKEIKKTFCKRDKNVTIFLLAFDVGPLYAQNVHHRLKRTLGGPT